MMNNSSHKYEKLSEDLISLAPDCIVTTDLKGVITSFNAITSKITGYSEDELIGKHFSQLGFLGLKDIPKYKRIFQSLLKGKKPKPFEVMWCRKNGTQFSAIIQIDFIKKDNKIVGFQASTRDITESKLMKKALKESESKFKQFFEKCPDYCYIVSSDGKIIDVNQSALSFLGYKKEEIVGKPVVTTIYAPSSVEKAKNLFKKWKKTGNLTNEELNIITEMGEERTVLLSVGAVKDSNGKLLHSISMQRDITVQKQAEKALKESEKRYHTLFEKSPISITLLDKSGIIIDMNKATEKLIGYPKGEIIGKSFDQLLTLDPKDLPKLKEIYKKLLNGLEVNPYELEIKRKDGKKHYIYVINSLLMKDDRIVGFQIISTDITDKKMVEETLRESEEKFRTLTENVNVGVYRNTPGSKGKFIEANPAIVKMFGYKSKEEFLKRNVSDLYQNPEDRKKFIEEIKKKGFVQNEELLLEKNDGTSFIGSVSAVAIKDEGGEIIHYDGIIEDITERKEIEEHKRKLNLELKRKIDERSERIEILLNASQRLQVEKNWEKGLKDIVETMSNLGFDQAGIFLVNPLTKRLVFHFGKGIDLPEVNTSISLSEKEYYGVRSVLEKRTIHIQDAKSAAGKQIGSGSDSFAWIPIMVQDEAFAAVAVGNFKDKPPITEEDVKDLKILAGICGNFIDRTRILVEPAAEKTLSTTFKHWIDPSEGYIVLEKKPKKSLEIFRDLVTHGISGFIISRIHPEKIKRKYMLLRTPVLWLSRYEIDNTLNPDDLPKLNYIINDFTRRCEESVILLDGVEYLITQIGFETVIKYLHQLKDIVVKNRSRLIIPFHKDTISRSEFSILEKEFIIL